MFLNFSCVISSSDEEKTVYADDESKEVFQENQEKDKLEDLEEKMEELESGKSNISVNKYVIRQDVQTAEKVKVAINVGACKLNISGGTKHLFLGGFAYTQDDWKPVFSYTEKNQTGFMEIKQPEVDDVNFSDEDKYVWNLKFGTSSPLEFDVNLGAGLTEIELGGLPVTEFNMAMGVGKTILDLRGNWNNDAEINLDGGIGLLQIYLPENTGVKLNILKALTSIETEGLKQLDDNTYVNDSYNKSKHTMDITLKTGIGKIEIK